MATEVVVPMLGVTIEKGTIVEWLKKEGDHVEKGESIFVVEVEKATTEVESPAAGILAKILLPVGQEVPVLTVAAIITEPGEEVPEKYLSGAFGVSSLSPREVPRPQGEPAVSPGVPEHLPGGTVKIVPAARKLALERGLTIGAIQPSGPDGVVTMRDVERAEEIPAIRASTLARRTANTEGIPLDGIEGTGVRGRIMRADVERTLQEDAAPGLGKVIPMDSMRKVIARRMSESAFTTPHIYFFTSICMDPLLNFRKEIADDFEAKFGNRPSVNDFLIKAVALNILDFPMLNATIRDEEIHILADVNVCLAVALPDGLIVPAIANADRAGLANIVEQRIDLVKRARSGNLSLEELQRGTFTISSLAQFDITHFTAIINPPQSGILSVGKTVDELYLSDGAVKSRITATFGLSVDHRIIDGAVAAAFLQELKAKLQKPTFTFLSYWLESEEGYVRLGNLGRWTGRICGRRPRRSAGSQGPAG